MPYDRDLCLYARPFRFAIRRAAGDAVTREEMDAAYDDLVQGINDALVHLVPRGNRPLAGEKVGVAILLDHSLEMYAAGLAEQDLDGDGTAGTPMDVALAGIRHLSANLVGLGADSLDLRLFRFSATAAEVGTCLPGDIALLDAVRALSAVDGRNIVPALTLATTFLSTPSLTLKHAYVFGLGPFSASAATAAAALKAQATVHAYALGAASKSSMDVIDTSGSAVIALTAAALTRSLDLEMIA